MYFVKNEVKKYYFKMLVYLKFNVNSKKMTNSNVWFDASTNVPRAVERKIVHTKKLWKNKCYQRNFSISEDCEN